jgi:NADH-quinone oxidoreductase subunit C
VNELSQDIDQYWQMVVSRVEAAFPEATEEVVTFKGELTLIIRADSAVDVCTLLRDDAALSFNYMCDLSAVDMYPLSPRFEVNIHLLALPSDPQPGQGTTRLRVKIRLHEESATMPSLTSVWPSIAWYEREVHELYGIGFDGHPDLRPLLLPEDWSGTPPMRRDVPVKVEEVAFSFNRERIYRNKPFVEE